MDILKNGVYRASVENWSAEGMGVARLGGLVVFIQGGVPGDVCDIQILKLSGHASWARLVKLVTPSPHRVIPACPAWPLCGGCDFQHVSYAEELRAKTARVQEALRRIGGVSLEIEETIGADTVQAYRNKAIFPVGCRDGAAVTGFFRRRSHDIVASESCEIQSPAANTAARAVRGWMDAYGIPAYDEKTHSGLVRQIFVRTNAAGQALVCLVCTKDSLPHTPALLCSLQESLPSLAGVVVNINSSHTNTVLSDRFVTLWGNPYLEDMLGGLVFRLSVPSFYQINRAQAQRLYARASEYAALDKTQKALDLYCGTGTITLTLAQTAGSVVGVEVVPEAVEDARENARRNGVENARFFCADASQTAQLLEKIRFSPDVVCVDPPRKGLDGAVIDCIETLAPARVVYISCDPATLARDIKLLSARGFSPVRATVVDMFPRTVHVETVVLMTKCGIEGKKRSFDR